MRKQKLSPEASKAKAVRDKKIAMTGHRKKRKRENERMGQRSDSDIHHTKDGKQVRVPIKDNRGNFGKGTKNEGPNMMGQTWLNRKINGPSAIGGEGDKGGPVKEKVVKPYQSIDMADYNKRTQMYNDSASAHEAVQKISSIIQGQSGGEWDQNTFKWKDTHDRSYTGGKEGPINYDVVKKLPGSFRERADTDFGLFEQAGRNSSAREESVSGAISNLLGLSDDKPKKSTTGDGSIYRWYGDNQHHSLPKSTQTMIKGSIDKLKRTDKTLGFSPTVTSYQKRKLPGETEREYSRNTSWSSFITGDIDESVIKHSLPERNKPIQPILPPITKKKDTITKSQVKKKKRPVDKISKMPAGKLKSKSAPEKLSYRKPSKTERIVMGKSGKKETAFDYQKRTGVSDDFMERNFFKKTDEGRASNRK